MCRPAACRSSVPDSGPNRTARGDFLHGCRAESAWGLMSGTARSVARGGRSLPQEDGMRDGSLGIFLLIGALAVGPGWSKAWDALGDEVRVWTDGALALPGAD